MELNVLTPDFSVVINGTAAPEELRRRLISLSITDEAGIQSDSCSIELDDYDDSLHLPRSETPIDVSIGYKETGLVKIGTYYVKEVSLNGARRVMRISAHAMKKQMRSQKNRSHLDETLAEALEEAAQDSGLDYSLAVEYIGQKLEKSQQFGESDLHFLTRKAQDLGAISKPTNGRLVFAEDLEAKSVSGVSLPVTTIDISQVIDFSCELKETEAVQGEEAKIGTVVAEYYDEELAETLYVETGAGEPVTILPQKFSSAEEARGAVKGKEKRIVKSLKNFSFTTCGNPNLLAEYPVKLTGFSKKIPTDWIITTAEHVISSDGYKTSIKCTVR